MPLQRRAHRLSNSDLKSFLSQSVVCPPSPPVRWHSPCHSLLRRKGEKNEIYTLTVVGRTSNVSNTVGSGGGAGARIYRGRVLHEDSNEGTEVVMAVGNKVHFIIFGIVLH